MDAIDLFVGFMNYLGVHRYYHYEIDNCPRGKREIFWIQQFKEIAPSKVRNSRPSFCCMRFYATTLQLNIKKLNFLCFLLIIGWICTCKRACLSSPKIQILFSFAMTMNFLPSVLHSSRVFPKNCFLTNCAILQYVERLTCFAFQPSGKQSNFEGSWKQLKIEFLN